ncbi:RNA polymerase sigma factor [Pandoraea sputorum]|uniref:RNA polymerase sigma factor n=1 Tax=Pandoraea sputorum TaxID=93222 RepID=UPI002AF6B15B|nr:RNA polymerase sigma factor [Pandoraea sputorum]
MNSAQKITKNSAIRSPVSSRKLEAQDSLRSEFSAFIAREYSSLLNFVRRRVSCPQASEDIVQATLLHAHQDIENFRREASMRSWIFGILTNQIRKHYRSQAVQRQRFVSDDDVADTLAADDDPEKIIARSQRIDHLSAFIGRLEDRMRSALYEVSISGQTYDAVADQLDIPVGTLRSRVSRIREKLRAELEQIGVGRFD